MQRVRNILYVAAAPDLMQMADVERFLPEIVLKRLTETTPREDLPKILYWVATHPDEGDDEAMSDLPALGLPKADGALRGDVRARAMLYAFKMVERTTGAAATP